MYNLTVKKHLNVRFYKTHRLDRRRNRGHFSGKGNVPWAEIADECSDMISYMYKYCWAHTYEFYFHYVYKKKTRIIKEAV